MAKVRFLATSTDPRPGHEGTTYGPGHETDIDETDYQYVIALRQTGAIEIIDPTGLPTEPSPEGVERAPIIALPGF